MSSFNQLVPSVNTLINSSNCIVLGNTSSGTALTVQQIGAGAVMNVATSTGSSALFVSSTGQVGVGQASPLALFHSNVNTTAGVPDAIIGNHVIKSYNVSLALAATSFSNICTITASSGNGVVYLDVVQNETGAGSAISYTVPMTYQATGNAWRLLLPMNIANLNTPNYAQVLFKQTYNEATFALYRPALATSGTANFTCTFRVSQNQANPVTFADKTDTTTLAAITTLYQYTQLTQTATGLGIGTTNPTSLLHVQGGDVYASSNINGNAGNTTWRIQPNYNSSAPYNSVVRFVNAWDPILGTGQANYGAVGINLNSYQGGSQVEFYTSSTNNAVPTQRMVIGSGGNVGIGTTNPGATFDVAGIFKVNGTTGAPYSQQGSPNAIWQTAQNLVNLGTGPTNGVQAVYMLVVGSWYGTGTSTFMVYYYNTTMQFVTLNNNGSITLSQSGTYIQAAFNYSVAINLNYSLIRLL